MEALASRLTWNLDVLVFVEGGKLESPKKPRSKSISNNKLNLHETASTRADFMS